MSAPDTLKYRIVRYGLDYHAQVFWTVGFWRRGHWKGCWPIGKPCGRGFAVDSVEDARRVARLFSAAVEKSRQRPFAVIEEFTL